jgi:cytochrome c biogenesis protein CcmG, thiol:disulfide interchange protein DsbE
MLRLTTLVPVGLFAAIAATLGMGLGNDPRALPTMLADRPVPKFSLPPLVENIDGLTSADLEGRGVTLLNVFASWCGGCRYEHPLLMQIAKDKRVKLVAINWKDRPRMGASWIAQYGNPYAQIGEDKSGRTGIDLGVTGLPETFVIDGGGRVRYRLAGPMTPEIWKTEIEPLIVDISERAKGKT